MTRPLVLVVALSALTGAAASAAAQEVLMLGGANRENALSETTYAWTVEYAHRLRNDNLVALSWINEGHFTGHHRDGPTLRFSREFDLAERRPSIDLGIGAYAYFDTVQATEGASYGNDHGLGLIYTAGLAWPAPGRWHFHLRANRVETDGPDTTSLLFGAGYRFDRPSADSGPASSEQLRAPRTRRSEFAVFMGGTILNSYSSETSVARAIEYRRGLRRNVDWTFGWLHEGSHEVIRRDGLTSQVWLVQSFLEDELTLGVGGGAYFVLTQEDKTGTRESDEERVSTILTIMASHAFSPRWSARLSLNRVMTGYSRDTDVVLLGAGYRF